MSSLSTLRKAVEFVWDVVTLALLFSPVIAFAVSAAVGIGRLLGLGSDGQIAFITTVITVCGIPTFVAVRWRQAARREDEAARVEAKRKAEEQRARQDAEGQRKRALAREWVTAQWEERSGREQAAWAEAKRRKDEAERLEAQRKREEARQAQEMEEQERLWQGTGGPPRPAPNWIRSTWPNEATDFTPWLAKHLELVSACTGLDLRFEGTEVYAGGGRADIVARDHKSKSRVVIENQLDAADLDHRKQLALYGEALNAKIRIWIAANFNASIRRDVRNQNRQNKLSGGAIYYLLRLRPDRSNPISLAVGPTNSQTHLDSTDVPLWARESSIR